MTNANLRPTYSEVVDECVQSAQSSTGPLGPVLGQHVTEQLVVHLVAQRLVLAVYQAGAQH